MQATRAIVRLDKFLGNFKAIRERVGPQRQICVPVKADAYGHGAAAIAQASLTAGASFLGVAKVSEGPALRQEGLNAPMLLFSQPLPDEIPEIIKNRLIPLVSDNEFTVMLDRAAAAAAVRLPVHLKIDSGMGRIGCPHPEAPALAKFITACAALEYAGTATHLAIADSADPDDYTYTERQIACFNDGLNGIRAAGLNPGIIHAANSGAIILHPQAWFDMVRPGILLYGYKAVEEAEASWLRAPLTMPSGSPMEPLQVEPVMELRTNVVLIKQVKEGESISYGRTWIAPQDTNIAVLPIGYGDGLPRLVSNKWQVFIGGKAYPLTGRICMDQCMADLGPAPDVRRWDEAVLFGGPAPSAAVLARQTGTIPYEITCNINKRVPRVYVN
jgi:alanine racemase